jgi:hypothetical protein
MHDTSHNDDILFDRLVDGELSAAERRQLLLALDDRPDGWRRCALRFLEAQCMTESLRQFLREPITRKTASVSTDCANTSISLAEATSNGKSERRGASWAAIAAGLLIAFTLGLIARSGGSRDGAPLAEGPVLDPNASIAQGDPPSAPDANPRNDDDALTLFVRDETGQTRPVRVPLVDAQTLDRQLGLQFRTGVPEELRSRLQDRGFDVQSKRSYAPLWFEDGRPMFVPVEDTKIVPVRQNVY